VAATAKVALASATAMEATTVAKEAATAVVAKEATITKLAPDATLNPKAAAKMVVMATGTHSSGGGWSGVAQADVEKAPGVTPDLKMAPKRAAMVTWSGGSDPPPK
jgi:hypothetical protein